MSSFPVQFLSLGSSAASGGSSGRDREAESGQGADFDAALAAQDAVDGAPVSVAPQGAASMVGASAADALSRAALTPTQAALTPTQAGLTPIQAAPTPTQAASTPTAPTPTTTAPTLSLSCPAAPAVTSPAIVSPAIVSPAWTASGQAGLRAAAGVASEAVGADWSGLLARAAAPQVGRTVDPGAGPASNGPDGAAMAVSPPSAAADPASVGSSTLDAAPTTPDSSTMAATSAIRARSAAAPAALASPELTSDARPHAENGAAATGGPPNRGSVRTAMTGRTDSKPDAAIAGAPTTGQRDAALGASGVASTAADPTALAAAGLASLPPAAPAPAVPALSAPALAAPGAAVPSTSAVPSGSAAIPGSASLAGPAAPTYWDAPTLAPAPAQTSAAGQMSSSSPAQWPEAFEPVGAASTPAFDAVSPPPSPPFAGIVAATALPDPSASQIASLIAGVAPSPPLTVAPDQAKVRVAVMAQRTFLPPAATLGEASPSRLASASESPPPASPVSLAAAQNAPLSAADFAAASQAKPIGAVAPGDIGLDRPGPGVGLARDAAANRPTSTAPQTAADKSSLAIPAPAAAPLSVQAAVQASLAAAPPALSGGGAPILGDPPPVAANGAMLASSAGGPSPAPSLRRDLDVALEPAGLGGLSVRLKSRGDRLEIAFVAQRDETARLIDSGGSGLESQLRSAGLGLGGLELSVASGAGGAASGQAQQSVFSGGGGFSPSSQQGGASFESGSRQNSSNEPPREQAHDGAEQTAVPGASRSDRDLYL